MQPSHSQTEIADIINQSRRQFVQLLSLFSMGGTIIAPITLYFIGDPHFFLNGILFLIGFCIFLLNTYVKNNLIVYWAITIVAFFSLLFLNFSPKLGISNNDSTFITLFPMLAIFFTGKKYGLLLTLVYLFVTAILVILKGSTLSLNSGSLYQIGYNLIMITFIIYLYQNAEDKAQTLIELRGRKLQEEIKQNEEFQKKLQENVEEIKKQKDEVEQLNKAMIGRELVMADLKKKLQEMEKKLSY